MDTEVLLEQDIYLKNKKIYKKESKE